MRSSTNLNRGDAACDNRLRVPRKILEGGLLDIIRKDLLSEEAIDIFMADIIAELSAKRGNNNPGSRPSS